MNNRKLDTEFCGRVPLSQTNLIQPHGVLLVVRKKDFIIIQVSENIGTVFKEKPASIVNKPLASFLAGEELQQLKERSKSERKERLPFTFSIAGTSYLSLIHAKDEYLMIEIELPEENQKKLEFINVYQELKLVMSEVDAASTTTEACYRAIKELKRLSGFDKIMMYQFDADWNGTVIAEVAEEGMESYLGLRFPPSDIPRQARDLYLKNPYRFIPDVDYTPVKLYPLLNPLTNAFMDLSDTNLRSVAGVHLEYLRNMGVKSSMSTRILQEGRLWGLISCHHRTRKYLSYESCFIFELVANVVSTRLTSLQKADSTRYRDELYTNYNKLIERIFLGDNLPSVLKEHQHELLDLLKAEGAALVINKQITLFGKTPSLEEVENLVFWLRSNNIQKLYSQDNLSNTYADAESFAAIGSGLMVLPIQPEKGSYVLAFRPEVIQEIEWGGNPNEVISFEADKKNYHPRNSFKLWQETVRHTAVSWTTEELEVAENFRNFLVEFTLNKS